MIIYYLSGPSLADVKLAAVVLVRVEPRRRALEDGPGHNLELLLLLCLALLLLIFLSWGQLYKNRSSRKINSQGLFSRE